LLTPLLTLIVFGWSPPNKLIPRQLLFGNADYSSPLLSPDGSRLLYFSPCPSTSVLNAYIRRLSSSSPDEMLQRTNNATRPIRPDQVFWAQDSSTVLYLEDTWGDEVFRLHAAAVPSRGKTPSSTTITRILTPPGVKVSNVLTNAQFPDIIRLGMNERDPTVFDMYSCNLTTGKLQLDAINPGSVIQWQTHEATFEIRVTYVKNEVDASTTIRVRDSDEETSLWRDLITFPHGEDGRFVCFCRDNTTCLVTSSLGGETTTLLRLDLQTGQTLEEIFCHDQCDIEGIVVDNDGEPRVVGTNYDKHERHFFDSNLEEHYRNLESLAPEDSEFSVCSKTRDERLWIVKFQRWNGPEDYVFYNVSEKTTRPLFISKPELMDYEMARREVVQITARDGLKLVGYLTRASLERKTPLVLLVHGGPWNERDYGGFDAMSQWFANRGYACLQVNFRGSKGYGKTFRNKGDKQWGIGSMQHDLTDSVKWAIDKGIAEEDKICIYGGSYGGYACLAGLAFTPGLYKCGICMGGFCNVKRLLDSIPSYWKPLRTSMLRRIGDVDNDEEWNRKISPIFHADNMRGTPLLLGTGARDPRVPLSDSDQLAQTLGESVEYCVYPEEGHAHCRPANSNFNDRTEFFLAKHLGGRMELLARPSNVILPLLEGEMKEI